MRRFNTILEFKVFKWSVIIGLIKLGRPVNLIMGVLALFLGASIVSGELPTFIPLEQVIVLMLAGFLLAYSIMVVNDIVDVEADRVNAPWRPIASGFVSIDLAWRVSVIAILLGLGLTLYIEPLPLTSITALWFLGLAHLYNLGGKRFLLIGNIIVAFLTAFPLLYGVVLASYYMGGFWSWGDYVRSTIFWFMVFLSTLGREVSKGIVDIEGDRITGVRTIANTYGARRAGFTALTFYMLAALLSLIPVALDVVNIVPYLVVIVPVDLLALLEGLKLAINPTKENAQAHKSRILLLMLLAMLGLYMGSTKA